MGNALHDAPDGAQGLHLELPAQDFLEHEEEMKAAIAKTAAARAAKKEKSANEIMKRPAAAESGKRPAAIAIMKRPAATESGKRPAVPKDRTPIAWQGGKIYDDPKQQKVRCYKRKGDRIESGFSYKKASRHSAYQKAFTAIEEDPRER